MIGFSVVILSLFAVSAVVVDSFAFVNRRDVRPSARRCRRHRRLVVHKKVTGVLFVGGKSIFMFNKMAKDKKNIVDKLSNETELIS